MTDTPKKRGWSLRRSTILALVLALCAVPAARLLADDPAATGDKLMAHQLHLLRSGAIERDRAGMRRDNPEWDFMGRTFLALALANRALDRPQQRAAYLADLDRLIDDTQAQEAEGPVDRFLLPYVHRSPFLDPEGHSLFVDGEIALMLAARQLVERAPRHDAALHARIERVVRQMRAGPVLSGESYPDECWTFCNTTALAAVRLYDVAYGRDHGALLRDWVAMARARLIDPTTGLLVSSYTYAGEHLDGPEGSSLWMTVHNLRIVDPALARQQYQRARAQLRGSIAGYGYAREWPAARPGKLDVDAGFVVPELGAGSASSGLALVGAGAFGDRGFQRELVRSLHLAADPVEVDGRLRFARSNQVGDAVMAYGLVQGALWERARPDRKR